MDVECASLNAMRVFSCGRTRYLGPSRTLAGHDPGWLPAPRRLANGVEAHGWRGQGSIECISVSVAEPGVGRGQEGGNGRSTDRLIICHRSTRTDSD